MSFSGMQSTSDLFRIDSAFEKSHRLALNSNKRLNQLGALSRKIADANAKIAATNERIANAAETQNAIGQAQLAEAQRQTKLAERQLAIAELQNFERERQVELKQAAFEINEVLDRVAGEEPVLRYFVLRQQKSAVLDVGLNAASLDEISDKNYVRDVLNRLLQTFENAEREVGVEFINDLNIYEESIVELDKLNSEIDVFRNDYKIINKVEKKRFTFLDFAIFTLYPLKAAIDHDIEQRKKDGKQVSPAGCLHVFFVPCWALIIYFLSWKVFIVSFLIGILFKYADPNYNYDRAAKNGGIFKPGILGIKYITKDYFDEVQVRSAHIAERIDKFEQRYKSYI